MMSLQKPTNGGGNIMQELGTVGVMRKGGRDLPEVQGTNLMEAGVMRQRERWSGDAHHQAVEEEC